MRTAFRWIVRGLLGLVLLVVLGALGLYGASAYRLNQTYDIAVSDVPIPSDSVVIARGRHIATTRGCGDCHGSALAGTTAIQDPMIGAIRGPNLTPAGVGGTYDEIDWVRAIRHGIAPDGTPLVFMPSWEYYHLSDEDLGALIAYLKQLPPRGEKRPEPNLGPMGRALMLGGAGNFELSAVRIDHDGPRPEVPEADSTVAYGEYMAHSCVGCHGQDLSGGPISGAPPSWPPAANLTPHDDGIGSWSRRDFFRALREQERPDGTTIDSVMPPDMGEMTDTELTALWKYLQTVEPRPSDGG